MARPGLFKQVSSPDDQRLQRIQDNINVAVSTLSSDHDVLSVPVTSMLVTGQIQAGKSVVVFIGATGQKLTLPQAKAQGANVSAQLIVLNTSPNVATLIPTAGDTINGGTSLAIPAGVMVLLSSDGITKWLGVPAGVVSDGDKGDVIVSGGGTVWTIDSAYSLAQMERVKTIASYHP